jgi:hypothetical protein
MCDIDISNGSRYDSGHRVYTVVYNPHARNPTYQQVIDFLKNDKTDLMLYVPGNFMCADFAFRVQANASKVGIRCGIAAICFKSDDGHACNVWHTTDRGLIFTESMGPEDLDNDPNIDSYDVITNIVQGKPIVSNAIFNDMKYTIDEPVQDVIIMFDIW